MTDPGIVLDLIDAFRGSKAMFTAVSLGVFDRLPATYEASAAACVGLRLLRKDVARRSSPSNRRKLGKP
jgi:hypothetical protein